MVERQVDSPWRIGVIGAGRIVERAHLTVLSEMPDVQIVGLFDPDGDRARAVARRFGVPYVCASEQDLLALKPDVVLVACPNYLHATMSIAALAAGAHVLCEKPMAVSVAQAEAMIEAAERHGRELIVGFTNRFRLEVGALQRVVQAGDLGEITAIRCGWLRRSGIPGVGTWFTCAAQSGGGVLVDLGSHLIDLAIWLGGQHELLAACCALDRRTDVQAQAAWYEPTSASATIGSDVEISAAGLAVLSGPLTIFVETSWSCAVPHDQTYLHLLGRRGAARLETVFGFSPSGHRPEYPLRIWRGDPPDAQEIAGTVDALQPYRDQWRYFVDSLRSGRSLRPWLRDSLTTVRVIEAMYRSADNLAER